MKRIIRLAGLPILGVALVFAGLIYDVMFAGIPYQDPTPELQARWKFHQSVAGLICKLGSIVLLLGVLALPFIARMTRPSATLAQTDVPPPGPGGTPRR